MSGTRITLKKKGRESGSDEQQCSPPVVCCEVIRETAYYKWQAAGCPLGDGVDFWLEAEAEIIDDGQSAARV